MSKGYHTWPDKGTKHPVREKHKKKSKKQKRVYYNNTYEEKK